MGGGRLSSSQGASRYDHSLYFGSPLVNLGYLRVAVIALYRIALGIAVSAVDLDGLARYPCRNLRCEQLSHRPLRGIRPAVFHARCRALGQVPCVLARRPPGWPILRDSFDGPGSSAAGSPP